MFIVFYTLHLDICVFITFSTPYCLHDTLMDPWNACIYERMYVFVYVLNLKHLNPAHNLTQHYFKIHCNSNLSHKLRSCK